ncbi:MAG: DUF4416 family protein [Candidatus Omnitrophota bacterium]|nr:DUF4416 family protein [Candidatus Omnitrophota bacterium]
MGKVLKQEKVKLVASIIYKSDKMREIAEKKIEGVLGRKEALEKELTFDLTDYYYGEMGGPLRRKLLCFKGLADKENIEEIKIRTNRLESKLAVDGKRTVNIDPGYITEAKLVLLTTKDYVHRVHIGKKIFAETTLHFCGGRFNAWPWTYPDYASEEIRAYFESVRGLYVEQLKAGRK